MNQSTARHELRLRDESRRFEASTSEVFDRVAFARRALRALARQRLTVAIYLRHAGTRVDTVRDLRRGSDARWVTLGVARDATREQIAYALAEAAGIERTPFAIECLLNAMADAPRIGRAPVGPC